MVNLITAFRHRAHTTSDQYRIYQDGQPTDLVYFGNIYAILLDIHNYNPEFLPAFWNDYLLKLEADGIILQGDRLFFPDGTPAPWDVAEDIARAFKDEYLRKV